MISKKELQDYAKLKGLNLGNAEKDYLLDIALLSISKHTKNELIFKGGTCLYKFHKLNRFSEDLDFSAVDKINIDNLISHIILDFEKFGIKACIHKKKEPYNSILITLRLEGPLSSGNPTTFARIGIDINISSSVELTSDFLKYTPIYPEISEISVLCMNPEEIFAEKIRALMTRNRARDLFDLSFLLKKNIHAKKGLINKKMKYYNIKFDVKKLITNIKSLEKKWKNELSGFTSEIPDFNQVSKNAINSLKKIY